MATILPSPTPDDATKAGSLARVTVAGQDLTLFEESPALIDAMVADIRAANTRVWMETYVYADDAAGRRLADVLAERAQAGLDVRLIVDAWGSYRTPTALFSRLRAAGVEVHLFHAVGEAIKLKWFKFARVLNQRNHRKLLVIDESIAYFGGMNVVDQSGIYSVDDAKRRQLPVSAGWRDVHVRLVGPRALEIAAVCQRLWQRVHKEPRTREPAWQVKQLLRAREESLFFFASRPSFKYRRPQRVLIPLIDSARKDITLAIAYFIPMGRVLRALLRARRRGVRVRVIVPGQSDVKVVQWAARHIYDYLLKRGIEIYERNDRMLHSKVMVIDGRWSVIGSCNLDARSLRLNLEFFAVALAKPLAQVVERICEEEIRNSVLIDEAFCRRRSWIRRLRDRAAWSLRRWL